MTMNRPADRAGPAASAWLVEREPKTLDHTATLAVWIIDHRNAHPVWNQWMLGLVHLRDIDGVKPAAKAYPEAEFEVVVHALDPQHQVTDPNAAERLYLLTPPDVVKQFHGVSDEVATFIVERLVEQVVAGHLSPDQDHRTMWNRMIDSTVAHFRGEHEHEPKN